MNAMEVDNFLGLYAQSIELVQNQNPDCIICLGDFYSFSRLNTRPITSQGLKIVLV